jgi:hypothetical protein
MHPNRGKAAISRTVQEGSFDLAALSEVLCVMGTCVMAWLFRSAQAFSSSLSVRFSLVLIVIVRLFSAPASRGCSVSPMYQERQVVLS